ncbi:hypothetical protein QBC43DRAFT_289635 [Cladorrhinum sp. PSN259]|nr:hypothetical protein QBC43DRAFT_289635 [Cladorrhinum sp. PSN259]
MKLLAAILTTLLPVIMASPAPGPDGSVPERRADSTCNPYTDWGHTQGTHSYFCANLAPWPSSDYNCVEYKSADYCSGKIYCDSANVNSCGGSAVCYYGICVQKVNAKQCQRTCTY